MSAAENPYLPLVQDDTAQSLRQSMMTVVDKQPDTEAKLQALARQYQLPVDAVRLDHPEVERRAKLDSIDYATLARELPVTSSVLSDPDKAAVSHDDVDNMSALERTIRVIKGTGTSLFSAGMKFNEGAWGVARAGAELLPDFVGKPMAESFARMGKSQREKADTLVPKTDSLIESSWYSGMQSLGLNLLQLPLGIGGKMTPVLTSMGVSTAGQNYGEARDKGIGVGQSLVYGTSQGVIEAGTEMIGMPALFGMLKPGKFSAKALEYMVKEQGGEQIATHLQDLNQWAVLNPEKTFGDYLRERPNAALQTALSTAFAGGGQVAVMKSVQLVAGREQAAVQSEENAAALGELDQLAAASKVRARDAQTFEQFIQQATEDGPVPDVYISASALYQSGIADQVAAVSPAVAGQIEVALQTGGDVRIPVAEYLTRIAGTELSAPLLDHLRTDENGFSRAEAADFMQSRAEILQQEMARELGDKQNDATFMASRDAVRDTVLAELNTLGRFSPEKNQHDATLIAAHAAVRAAQLGITPEAMFQKQRLRVQAENVAGVQQYGQPVTGEFAWEMGQRGGLFGLPAIEVTTLRGDELGADRATIKAAAIAKLKEVGKSGLRNADTGWDLTVGKKYRNKIAKWDGNKDAVLQAVGGIESLAANAVLAESHQDTEHHNPDVQGVHRLYAPVEIGGVMFRAKLTVKDYNGKANGQATKLHALEAIEIENAPMGTPPAYSGAEALRQAQPTSGRTFSIADLLAGSTMNDGRSWDAYYQGAASHRGAFDPSSNTIALLKNADLSTFLHEGAHFFFESDVTLANELLAHQREGASLTDGEMQVLADVSALLKWHGIQGGIDTQLAQWHTMDFEEKRSYHERTAESFEAYLLEGKSPSVELQRLFQTFRAWLLNVYKSLKAFVETHPESGKLNDEVRGVFDRMLATTEQIKLAEQGRSMMPLFESAMQAGMTPEEFAGYHALGIEATQQAIEELQSRGLRDMQWLSNKRGREIKKLQKQAKAMRDEVEIEARREVMSQPVYRAWQYLTGKLRTDSDQTTSMGDDSIGAGRLDAGSVAALGLPDAVGQRLRDLRMTAKQGGLHPDFVAEHFGFSSGDEMVRKLAAAEKPRDAIEGLTDAKMLERYGDLATPEAIERAADKAIHNEARARFVATEANVLAKAAGQRKILADAAKEFAAKLIARSRIRDLRPSLYANAESRAARAAEQASKSGDVAQAAVEKRNQLINLHAAKAAMKAREEVESTVRAWRTLANRSDKKLVKGYDLDILNAVRAILGEYGIAEKQAKRAGEYLDKLKDYDPAMYAVIEPSIHAAEANAKPYADLTVEELRGLRDEIDAIRHLAKRSRESEIDGNLLDQQELADVLKARMEEKGIPDHIPGETSAPTDKERALMGLQSVGAALRRVESWCDRMDGNQLFGPFRRFIFTPVKEAADRYRGAKAGYLRELRDILKPIRDSFQQAEIAAPELNYTFGKDSGGVGMNELLHVLLHMGNESNKRKLILGRNWGAEMADGHVDSSRLDAFIGRMIREGKLTQAHLDAVQQVWDLLEKMKPDAQKAHRDAYGKYFDEVTANPFSVQFPDGNTVQYRGGYVPAIADSRIVQDQALKKLVEEGNDGVAFAFPSTANGFTKSRVEYNRPLLLDLRLIGQHIDKVLLFSHLENPVRDVARLLNRNEVSKNLSKIDPSAINGMLIPWLNRSARQQVSTPFQGLPQVSSFLSTLRSRAGMALMFGNLSNAVQQLSGFSMAAVKVKPRYLLSAAAQYIGNPKAMALAVREASDSVRQRLDNEGEAVMGDVIDIIANPTKYQAAKQWTQRHAYFLQSAIESVMVPIIWTGAYNQALEQGASEKDAQRLADSAVRVTQGSTLAEDISRMETGNPAVRLFTQFVGYFNMQGNLLATEIGKAKESGDSMRAVSVVICGLLVSAWVAEAIALAFKGGPDDEDKDGEYLDDWLLSVFGGGLLKNSLAMVPFAGQFGMAAVNSFNDKPFDDRVSMSPVVSMLEATAGSAKSVYKAASGEGSNQKAVRDVATALSMSTGLPFYFAARPVGYAAGVEQGKIAPTSAADAIRGFAVGSASPQSKN